MGAPLAIAANGALALALMLPVAWRMLGGGARPPDVDPGGEARSR